MRKQRIWQCICVALTCAMTAFIFLNSAQTAEVSDGVSHGVLAWIEALFERHGVQTGLTNHIIRKSGHFLEYFILGALLLATLRSFSAKIRQNIFLPLFFGLLVPVLDETLQLVVEDNVAITGDKVNFYHSGKIAVGRQGSGKIDELRMFVEELYPRIISGKRFFLGSIVNDRLWRLDDPDVIGLIENLISYSIVRDEYREYVKAKRN